MGSINTILAALFCATAPMGSLVVTQAPVEAVAEARLGKERISLIRAAYEKGEYDSFLKEMDDSYQATDLSGLIQMRQGHVPVEFQEKWEQKLLELQKERNQQLAAIIGDTDNSEFAGRVRSATINPLTPEQEKAFSRLNAFIAMAPNTGANADENKLIDIDLEYEYKTLHADLPEAKGANLSADERQAFNIALRMEKMDKMKEAAKSFQDLSLKQTVGMASDTLDAMLARNLDGAYLNGLLRNKAKPANETEEKAFAILSLYQGKFTDLMKEIDHANR